MKMKNQGHTNAVVALLFLVAAVLACHLGDETTKANKLVNEANVALDEGKKSQQEAQDKKVKMLAAIDTIKSDEDVESTKTIAKECIAALDKAAQKHREAAQKSDEASKLKLNEKFKEYLSLKVREYNKRAEAFDAMKGIPQAMIDSKSKASFEKMADAAAEKVKKLLQEATELGEQGDKIQKDNPDKIKAS